MNIMTLDEMILAEIEKTPLKKQSDEQKRLYEALKEKEYYRKDAIYWEQRAKRFEQAYRKLKEKVNNENIQHN